MRKCACSGCSKNTIYFWLLLLVETILVAFDASWQWCCCRHTTMSPIMHYLSHKFCNENDTLGTVIQIIRKLVRTGNKSAVSNNRKSWKLIFCSVRNGSKPLNNISEQKVAQSVRIEIINLLKISFQAVLICIFSSCCTGQSRIINMKKTV